MPQSGTPKPARARPGAGVPRSKEHHREPHPVRRHRRPPLDPVRRHRAPDRLLGRGARRAVPRLHRRRPRGRGGHPRRRAAGRRPGQPRGRRQRRPGRTPTRSRPSCRDWRSCARRCGSRTSTWATTWPSSTPAVTARWRTCRSTRPPARCSPTRSPRASRSAVVCHAPAALLAATGADGTSPFAGYRLTGFTNAEEAQAGLAEKAPWLLQDRLVALGADFQEGEPWAVNVVVDRTLLHRAEPGLVRPAGRGRPQGARRRVTGR